MSYNELLHHSILELDELNELIVSAQKECQCIEDNIQIKCIPCYDKEKVIFHHMRLIRKVCVEFSENSNLSADEFMADGIIGLGNAIKEFDLNQSNKFFHFARNAIRWQIMSGDLYGPTITIPSPARKKISMILKKTDEYLARGEIYTDDQMCKDLKITKSRLSELLDIIRSREIKPFLNDDLEEIDLNQQTLRFHYDSEDWMSKSDLKPALELLTEYQKKIILSYYGIEMEERTLRQLSKEFGQSYEKTRQDYHKALEVLRKFFKKEIDERNRNG